MICIYRCSKNSFSYKEKISEADKLYCFFNFMSAFFNHRTIVLHDDAPSNVLNEVEMWNAAEVKEVKIPGNATSFLEALDLACTFDDDEIIYIVEDDYLHKLGSPTLIEEGLELFDYVTLYDHPDKYDFPYKHQSVKVYITDSTHWRKIPSTTATFATRVGKLKEDLRTFKSFTRPYPFPQDHDMWTALTENGRSLASPIPGRSTHTEIAWISPFYMT